MTTLALMGLKGHQGSVLRGARELGDVKIVAVSDDSRRAVERLQRREPLAADAALYTDWLQLLEHSMPEFCCVADENNRRSEQLCALAERGVHVICEKPLTTTLADLARVEQAWSGSRGRLTMLLTMRHDPKYRACRRLVQQGAIGEVCQVTAQKSYRLGQRPEWFRSSERLGGIIPYIGIHPVDLIYWITGLDYTTVAALQGQIGRPDMGETANHASLLLGLSNGASATIRLDYLRPETAPTHGDDRLRIAGTKGVVEVRGLEPELSLITANEGPQAIPPEPGQNIFEAFVEAVREDRELPIPTADCAYVTRVGLLARQAAVEGRVVALEA